MFYGYDIFAGACPSCGRERGELGREFKISSRTLRRAGLDNSLESAKNYVALYHTAGAAAVFRTKKEREAAFSGATSRSRAACPACGMTEKDFWEEENRKKEALIALEQASRRDFTGPSGPGESQAKEER